ncbi:nuclear receptor 2C2-associated protein-like [Saccoglossus kowalevskii]|uniref:Nuclear receptor 2C2-associated protein-like n=1 Tax=Saccoglossus kowalevskii TaxID=10224 RepID=A0ABM0M1W5_SACKO|nr:PREDICTED: nuclear receptor 2C2-associated protein-like [Saccoglossus kowalevskii]
MAASIGKHASKIKVSSTLNRDVKQFGKKYMFDDDEETCWNSDQGSPQWVVMEFPHQIRLQELMIQFQGGFVGKECWIEGCHDDETMTKILDFYPEDVNSLQSFHLPTDQLFTKVKIIFNSSTDFYGRITIYKLDLIGTQIT